MNENVFKKSEIDKKKLPKRKKSYKWLKKNSK